MSAPAAPEAPLLASDRLRAAQEADWRRLETICAALEAGRPRRLSDADVLALPALYRQAVAALALSREISLDAATRAYLEALVTRAWFQLNAPGLGAWGWLKAFAGGGFSRALRALWVDLALALAVMVAGLIAGWALAAADPAWYGALVGDMAGGRTPEASAAALRATLFAGQTQGLGAFAAGLFGHNGQIALLCFALGFAFGVPSLLLLAQNMASLGAMLWLFAARGLLGDFVGWLMVHGTTELFALWLAGAAGLHIGRAMAFPGRQSVLAAAQAAGRRAALVMVGAEAMLVIAGLLEGFARQLVTATPLRAAIGAAMLGLWLWYGFVFARRGRP